MATAVKCPSCGKELPAEAPQGLCPSCLIHAGITTQPAPSQEKKGSFVPPPVRDIASLFPQLQIIEIIGHGGMGAVYKARQPALDRYVALKILPPETANDPGFAERFTREARALARLNHPNIVGVYDFGTIGHLHYFVMEYVEGGNLRQLQEAGRFTPREALKIIPQICDALQFAHDEGIVHRDIKPENVMLDRKGRVKITDFGLARLLGHEPRSLRLTGAKDVMGTPHYMAPEQIEHPQSVDHRADIYSLGVVFYEMLTGELPLGKFAPPSRKVEVDVRLDEVVLRTLEKEPELRYQKAVDVKTGLQHISDTPGTQASAAEPVPSHKPLLQRAALVARWTARIFSLLLFLFYGVFIVAEGLPPIGSQPEGVQLGFLALGLMLAGFLVGWRSDGVAACLIAGGWTIWNASEGGIRPNLFQTPLPLALLFAFSWWVHRGRKTARLIACTAAFGVALVLGIVFSPTSIFLSGTVTDAFTGQPIPNAEIFATGPAGHFGELPSARANPAGRYTVYFGLHRPANRIAIHAPGYTPLVTEAGPRPFPKRQFSRDFTLSPLPTTPAEGEAVSAPAPPVLVRTEPVSGSPSVNPNLREIRLVFDRSMKPNWAWVTTDNATPPLITGAPRFHYRSTTCILPVRLQPGRTYSLWINHEKIQGFQDTAGVPALPYLLIFKTAQ